MHNKNKGRCCPKRAGVRGFMQPWLLLLLAQRPAHGYELLEQLGQEESAPAVDPGLLYRTLRQFEQEGLVRSAWNTGSGGPARRVYEITEQGLDYLHTWALNISRTRERLDRFLAKYHACCQAQSESEY